MRDSYDVVVVGGGAMGLATGWRSARAGKRVLVLEQFSVGHTRGSSHGSARIFRLAYPDPRYISLARRAQELWRLLESEAGVSLLTVTGGVDHGDPTAVGLIEQHLREAGASTERLTAAEAGARWPGMRFDEGVLFQPDAGVLHADRTITALHQQLLAAGGDCREQARVQQIRQGSEGVEVHLSGEVLHSRVAVIAAGAWAPHLLTDAGLTASTPQLRVTQEQPGLFAAEATGWPVFLHHRHLVDGPAASLGFGHYGMSVDASTLKIGAHGTGPLVDPDHRPPVDPTLVASLEEYVADWLPGVSPHAQTVESCLYTSTPDEEFVLQRQNDIVVCSPCSGHGFKFVPAIGELTSRLASAGSV